MSGSEADLCGGLKDLQTAAEQLMAVQQKANDFIEMRQLEASGLVCEVDDFLQRFGGSRETHRSLSDRVKNLSDGMSHLSDYLGRMLESYQRLYPTEQSSRGMLSSLDFEGSTTTFSQTEEPNVVGVEVTSDVRAGQTVATTFLQMTPVRQVRTDHLDHLVGEYEASRNRRMTPPPPTIIQQTRMEPTTQFDGTLSWLESPSLFWIQPVTEIASSTLAEALKSASSWPLVGQPLEVGQYVAAPQEDVFYRARVMALAPNSNGVSFAQVLYIDYGNTDWVTHAVLKQLPNELFFYDWQSIRCQLAQVAPSSGHSWTEVEVQQFSDLLKITVDGEEISRDLIVEVEEVQSTPDSLLSTIVNVNVIVAELLEGKLDVGAKIVELGCRPSQEGRQYFTEAQILQAVCGPPEMPELWQVETVRPQSTPAETADETVNALTSRASGSQVRIPDAVVPRQQQFRAQIAKFHYPEYFYVSTADSLEDLRCFQAQINSFCTTNPPELLLEARISPAALVGSACIITSGDGSDEQFYRGEVLRHSRRRIQMETAEGPIMEETDALGILFVDWGVEEWKPVGKVYKIDHCIAAVPRYAIACRMGQVKPLGEDWPAAVEDKFNSLIGRTDLVIDLLGQRSDSFLVNILIPPNPADRHPHSISLADYFVQNNLAARCFE